MGKHQSEQVARAIAMLKENPKLTRYAAAKLNGITAGALYNSAECRAMYKRKKRKKAVAIKNPTTLIHRIEK